MRKVATIMGIPISIDIPAGGDMIFIESFAIFSEIDNRFSTYKHNSEVSNFNKGVVSLEKCSDSFKKVYETCEQFKKETNGYFDAFYNKKYDPSGYVKGYALEQAANYLKQKGYNEFLINAGGDIVAYSNSGKSWKIGITNPNDTKKILAQLEVDSIAIATSGTYERGDHIIDPITDKKPVFFKSVTIFGPSIVIADVYATVIFAMGERGLELLQQIPGYSCIYVDRNNELNQLLSNK
jgi:thiamine biosynthesis lipoprotein